MRGFIAFEIVAGQIYTSSRSRTQNIRNLIAVVYNWLNSNYVFVYGVERSLVGAMMVCMPSICGADNCGVCSLVRGFMSYYTTGRRVAALSLWGTDAALFTHARLNYRCSVVYTQDSETRCVALRGRLDD